MLLCYFQVEEKHRELHASYLETQEKLREVSVLFDFRFGFPSLVALLHVYTCIAINMERLQCPVFMRKMEMMSFFSSFAPHNIHQIFTMVQSVLHKVATTIWSTYCTTVQL